MNGTFRYLSENVPVVFSTLIILAISLISMEVASIVALPRIFLFIFVPPYLRMALSVLIAFIIFYRLTLRAQKRLAIKITWQTIALSLAAMLLFVSYGYRVIVLPVVIRGGDPISLNAVLPSFLFYCAVVAVFAACLFMRMKHP